MHLLSRCKNIDEGRIIALNLKREREKKSSPSLHKYPRFFFERFSNYSWIPFLLYTRRKTESNFKRKIIKNCSFLILKIRRFFTRILLSDRIQTYSFVYLGWLEKLYRYTRVSREEKERGEKDRALDSSFIYFPGACCNIHRAEIDSKLDLLLDLSYAS